VFTFGRSKRSRWTDARNEATLVTLRALLPIHSDTVEIEGQQCHRLYFPRHRYRRIGEALGVPDEKLDRWQQEFAEDKDAAR
jgi:hypothetical protein